MNGKLLFKLFSLVFLSTIPFLSHAQATCGGTFMDSGGTANNYSNGENTTTTICPSNPGEMVTVSFDSFNTESTYDALYVYNGSSTSSPQYQSSNLAGNVPGGISGGFWGTEIPGPFTASTPDGCLTFVFRSDSTVNTYGWVANVSCELPSACPHPSTVTTYPYYNTANIYWPAGNATQWEVIVQLANLPAPTATSIGNIVNQPYYIATGLNLGTSYKAYIRSICSATDVSNWTSKAFTTAFCTAPASSISNISNYSATVSWLNTSALNWAYVIVPAGAPAPLDSDPGTLTNSTYYTIGNLTCGQTYSLYLRTICTTSDISPWVLKHTFTTTTCPLTTGYPSNLYACFDTVYPCFDLTTNTPLILNGLNPAEYSVTYYDSLVNANNQTASLTTYCAFQLTRTMYAVLKKLSTGQIQILNFTINSSKTNPTQMLNSINQCDSDNNGVEIFNLSQIVSSSNQLVYYGSLQNALNQLEPITNVPTFTLTTANPTQSIFIREIKINDCDNIYQVQLNVYTNCNLSFGCENANSLCGSLDVPFQNSHDVISQTGNNYGCLFSAPNPTWFYFPISESGQLSLTIEQNTSNLFNGSPSDVDFILYGPFTNPTTPCSTNFTASNIVACSYSANYIEHAIISNAIQGQYYILMVTNYSNQAGYIKITKDSSSTADIDCTGIKLNAFIDANNNAIKDPTEQNFPLGLFNYTKNNGDIHSVASPSGEYTIYDSNVSNIYNLGYTINPNYTSMYNLTADSFTNISPISNGGITTYNFPVTITQSYTDLATALIPISMPRAGFTYKNKIIYSNLGNQVIANGMITYNVDPATTITSVSQNGTTPISNGFTYSFTDLLPFETREIIVTISVPAIPSVAINQLLNNTVSASSEEADLITNNNLSNSTQAVIASYDPNDITETHGEKILFSTFAPNDYLIYTIRFENTGNAVALNIKVNDVLDSKIDENSIEMISTSHNYTMDRVGNNLTWNFENVQLPVSTTNSDLGKGYITYKVKLKPGFAVGDIIPNLANIYFDYNPAITTNTFNTEFITTLKVQDFDASNFMLFPNPAKNSVQINLQNSTENLDKIIFYDVLGKMLKEIKSVSDKHAIIDISDLSKGVYMVEIKTETGLKQVKKLVKE